MIITLGELHNQLMYNPWTGYFYWKVSNSSRATIGCIAGTKKKQVYVHIVINKVSYLAHRLAWFYIYGYWPENDIDHKDQIKHHNWIDNLREASVQCNARNTGNFSTNTSGVKGVKLTKDHTWSAYIYINNKMCNLGTYKDFNNAVCARLAGEQCLEWSGCDDNSPAYLYVKEMLKW